MYFYIFYICFIILENISHDHNSLLMNTSLLKTLQETLKLKSSPLDAVCANYFVSSRGQCLDTSLFSESLELHKHAHDTAVHLKIIVFPGILMEIYF